LPASQPARMMLKPESATRRPAFAGVLHNHTMMPPSPEPVPPQLPATANSSGHRRWVEGLRIRFGQRVLDGLRHLAARGPRWLSPAHSGSAKPSLAQPALIGLSGAAMCALIALAVLGWGPQAESEPGFSPGTRVLSSASVSSSPSPTPPGAGYKALNLPNVWADSHPDYSGALWYQLEFDAPDAATKSALQAVWIHRACTNVEVFLNGAPLYSGGRMQEPVTRHCYRPHLAAFSPQLLKPRGNVLHLRVVGTAEGYLANRQRAGGLSAIEIGPHEVLAAKHADETFWHFEVFAYTAPAIMALGFMLLTFSLLARSDTPLRLFGLILIGSAIGSARVWWTQPPWTSQTMELLIVCTRLWTGLLGAIFLLKLARVRAVWPTLAFATQAIVLPLIMLSLQGPQFLNACSVLHILIATQLIGVMVFCAQRMIAQRHTKARAWFVLLPLVCGSMVLEALVQLGAVPVHRAHLALLLSPALWSIIGAYLMAQIGHTLQASEIARKALEERVRVAKTRLERSFAQMAELQMESAAQAERKRIAADLHDDLGAKLLTIVHTSESERIAKLAREALEEMRLSVRGLTGKPVHLSDALADWRAECVLRLDQAGIQADWLAPTRELNQWLPARTFVQTTRILREGLSNVIKHSGATTCRIRLHIDDGAIHLRLQDNGRGIALDLGAGVDRGHGLASMKQRARQMQGQCLVESGAGLGTIIRLTLPLQSSSTSRPPTATM
jgi:two-component system sensor histidine kinase UhpB